MPTKTDSARRGGQRRSLDRRRVLETSLAIVDEEGLEALTMRRLGAELGVDAMSVYGRVDGKDALLDGLVELLWSETAAPTEGGVEWTEQLRSFARSLRAIIRRHPHAAPLLFRPNALPESALVAFDGYLEILRDAGFDEPRAAEILRALIAYGRGYGMAELSCFVLSGPQQEQPSSPQERLVRLGQRLPRGISPRLARVAAAICAECDPDSDFEFGLDLILWGVRSVDRRAQASEQKTHIGGGGDT